MESLPQDLVLHMATQLHPWEILSLGCTNRALHGALADIVLPAGRWHYTPSAYTMYSNALHQL